MQSKKRLETELDLEALLKALWRKKLAIIAVAILFAVIAYAGTKLLITPKYQSKFTAYVNNRAEDTTVLTSSDLSASQSLTNTYSEIILSRTALETAAKNAGLDISYSKLRNAVSVDIASNTQIITIAVVLEDNQQAYALATAIEEYIPDYAANIVEGSSMKIIDVPYCPTTIYSPNYIRNAVLGGILGILVFCVIVLVRTMLDNRVKDQSDLERQFGIVIIGAIPDVIAAEKAEKKNAYGYAYGSGKQGV